MTTELPAGYTLDQPEQQYKEELPPDFVLDETGPILPGESISTLTGKPIEQRELSGPNTGIQAGAEMVSNVPGSAYRFGENIYQAVRHPIETGKNVAYIAEGAAEKLIPGRQEYEPYAENFGKLITDRYGSLDKFKATAVQDPVGVVADIAAVLTASGAALKGAGYLGKSSTVSEAGKVMQTVGAAAEPLNLVKQAASPIAKVVPKELPRKLYESSAKFGTTVPAEQRARMARLAVEEGIMPTGKGIDLLRGKIDNINTIIDTAIDSSTKRGVKIPSKELFKYLDDLKKEAQLSDDPIANLRAIDKVEKSIKSGMSTVESQKITAQGIEGFISPKQAQALKKRIYKAVNYENRPRTTKYLEDAKKQVARAAKEQIESVYPEIKNLNATEGAYIELLESLEKSANRISNRDIIGIGVPIKGGTGGVVAGPGGAAVGILSGVLDAPLVKAKLAIVLNKARKAQPQNKLGATAFRQALYEEGKYAQPPPVEGGEEGGGSISFGQITRPGLEKRTSEAIDKATQAVHSYLISTGKYTPEELEQYESRGETASRGRNILR